jgi:hypothetical protein
VDEEDEEEGEEGEGGESDLVCEIVVAASTLVEPVPPPSGSTRRKASLPFR